jgi:hypothetical protein
VWYRTRRSPQADVFAPPNIATFGNVTLGPSPEDRMRQMERDARSHGT